jgi:putative transposase
MSRKPRIHVPGGFYHVILRGNSRQNIFLAEADRFTWGSLVSDSVDRYEHRIHAYCWMTNHVHLAVQAGREPLAGCMGFLASNYARKFNLKTTRTGHLFERRYIAILIQEDAYLQELVRYIHMNPVRAGLAATPADYRWSSHHAYLGKSHPAWLTTDQVLTMFGTSKAAARKRYADFMGDPQGQSTISLLRVGNDDDSRALGDDGWLQMQLGSLEAQPEWQSLDELVEDICARHNIAEAELRSKSRGRRHARIRAEIALAAIESGTAAVSEVARRFGRSQPTLSRSMHRLRDERNKLNKL